MLFSRVLASHRRGPGSIPDRDMSVLRPLVKDGDDLHITNILKFYSMKPGASAIKKYSRKSATGIQ
jgi:hypothetical protein